VAKIRELYASDKRKKVTTIRNQHLEEFITALNTVRTKQCKTELPKVGVDIDTTHWVGGKRSSFVYSQRAEAGKTI